MLSVLVPAFNEEDAIGPTLAAVRQALDAEGVTYEIIVIDDGSEDATAERAAAHDVRVVSHPVNGGYGRALKSGMRVANYEWCAIVDADGSYPVENLAGLLRYVPEFDMVVGARMGKYYWGGPIKRAGRWVLLRMVEFVVGDRVPDVNSGMRIFRKEIALAHSARISSGFSFTTTITLAMLLSDHFVHFEPIEYRPRVGRSKVRFRKDVLRMIQIVVQATLYYNPLKIFLPSCLLALAVGAAGGAALALVDPVVGGIFFGGSILCALVIGAIGFLTESLRLYTALAPKGSAD